MSSAAEGLDNRVPIGYFLHGTGIARNFIEILVNLVGPACIQFSNMLREKNKMNTSVSHQKIAANRCSILAVVFVIFSLGITGCSSKTKLSPSEAKAEAFELLNEEVHSVITDPARANEIVELIEGLEKSFLRAIEDRSRHRRDFATLNADYGTPKEAFAQLMEQIETDEESNREKVVALRAKLVRATTADEWVELAKSKEKAFEASFMSLHAAK